MTVVVEPDVIAPQAPSRPATEPVREHVRPLDRSPALDGLRGIAILLVMEFHLYGFAPMFRFPGAHLARVDRIGDSIRSVGWSGVDLFFVLSGFLITRILLEAKDSPRYFRNFYARRALRIFPLYYGFLFALLIVLPLWPKFAHNVDLQQVRDHQGWYWSYLFNVWVSIEPQAIGGSFRNGHFWSLAVEEQFYLVWPALVLLLNRQRLVVAACLAVIGAFLVRAAILMWVDDGHAPYAAYNLTPARIDTFAIGALIAVAVTGGVTGLSRWAWPIIGVSLVALGLVFARHRGLDPFDPWVQTIGFSAIAALFGALLILTLEAKPSGMFSAVMSWAPLRFFGKYSYAMYIVHVQLAVQVNHRLIAGDHIPPYFHHTELLGRLLYAGALTAVTCVIAYASWHLFEKHFLKLKNRFR